MDLLNVLRLRIAALPQGDYTVGLKAVLQHIESAEDHFTRGKEMNDDRFFTDSIYRTNQAFEGSLKEAYRVIAGKDPSHETPANIEKFFRTNSTFRPRVLAQLTNYRQEWRNPSAHDYRLDFDDDEALFAIVAVTVFALVLVDQIIEQISFEHAKTLAAQSPPVVDKSDSPLERTITLIEQFVKQTSQAGYSRESEVIGAIAGYLAIAAPDITLHVEEPLTAKSAERPDLIIKLPTEKLLVEIKLSAASSMQRIGARNQISHYMSVSGISQGIVLFFRSPNLGRVDRREYDQDSGQGRIVILSTVSV